MPTTSIGPKYAWLNLPMWCSKWYPVFHKKAWWETSVQGGGDRNPHSEHIGARHRALLPANDVPSSGPHFSGWLQSRSACGHQAASRQPHSILLDQSASPSCPWWLPLWVPTPDSSLTAGPSIQGAASSQHREPGEGERSSAPSAMTWTRKTPREHMSPGIPRCLLRPRGFYTRLNPGMQAWGVYNINSNKQKPDRAPVVWNVLKHRACDERGSRCRKTPPRGQHSSERGCPDRRRWPQSSVLSTQMGLDSKPGSLWSAPWPGYTVPLAELQLPQL